MNERTHFFIKIYLSHFILERVDVSVVCERWVERHILRERTSFSHIFFPEPGGANGCTLFQAVVRVPLMYLIGCVTLAQLRFSALCPHGYHHVVSFRLHTCCTWVLWSRCCLLIKMWQLAKAHGVTWNKPKIHVICYITRGSIPGQVIPKCREEENLVFCFGALFNSTLNFTQSGRHILFSPDLHFRLAKWVSGQTHSLQLETATRTDVSLVAPA